MYLPKISRSFLMKYLAVIVAVSPIFSGYWIPGFPIMPVADILLILGYAAILIKCFPKIKVGFPALCFFIYVVLRQLFTVFNFSYSNFSSAVHVAFYYFFFAFILANVKQKDFDLKPVLIVAAISSLFIIFQTIVYYTIGKYPTGILPFFEHAAHVEEYANSVNDGTTVIPFRPRSLFSEPSTFANYVAIALSVSLPKITKSRKMLILSLIYTAGLLVSLSSTGIILCAGLWVIYGFVLILPKLKKVEMTVVVDYVKLHKRRVLIISIAVFVLCVAVACTPWFATFVDHTINGGFMNRMGNVFKGFAINNSFLTVLFGQGAIEIDYFVPEFVSIFVYWGILGYALVLANMRTLFCVKSKENLNLIFVCFALFAIGGFMATAFSPYTFYVIHAARIDRTSLDIENNT